MNSMNRPSNGLPSRVAASTPQSRKKVYQRMALGFTLIEMLVALGISSVGFAAGLMIFSSTRKTYDAIQMRNEVQQEFRNAFETITLELQATNTATIDTSVPYAVSFASAKQNGVFQKNADGTPNWQDVVVFFLDSGTHTLRRYAEPKSDWSPPFETASALSAQDSSPLVPDVTNLEFHLSGNILTVMMEISKSVPSADTEEPIATELTAQIYLRN